MRECIIIGGGCAGLMAAATLEEHNIDYLLLEKNTGLGKKLLITGGSRCNVTNNLDIDMFVQHLTISNKKFLYPALYTFGPKQILHYFETKGVSFVLENNFKYFPKSNKSQTILDAITNSINMQNVHLDSAVISITKDEYFVVKTKRSTYTAKNLILATGSKSYPKTGSTGDGLQFANELNLKTMPFTPAETHIYSSYVANQLRDLQGTTIKNSTVRILGSNIEYNGDLLFTHFGLSGPVIYHLSEFIYDYQLTQNVILQVQLTDTSLSELEDILGQKDLFILKALEKILTKRLSKKLLEILQIENKKISELSNKKLAEIIHHLIRFEIKIDKVEDVTKAYVNRGGIVLKELDPKTFSSKKVDGLYVVGETVDMHGPIGGFNITMAFASGKLAALNIIEKSKNANSLK